MKWEDSIKVSTERRLLCIHEFIKLKKKNVDWINCGKEKFDGHLLRDLNWFATPIEGVVRGEGPGPGRARWFG